MIEFKHVNKKYPNGFEALKDIDLTIGQGEFVAIIGLSGAGKSMAVNALEDIGFFCIDNIPAGLLPRILDFAQQGENQLSRVAVVMDIRGLHSVQETNEALEALDGVSAAEVSHTAGTAVVTLDKPVDDTVLKKAVEDKDYTVTGIE